MFKLEHSTQTRKSALAEYGLLDYLLSCAEDIGSVWHADAALEVVPAHILHSDRWKVERWGRWFDKEGVLTLDARALVE